MICVLLSTSCNDFFDVNTDPNNPSTATIDLVLPAGISSAGFVLGGQWLVLGSLWSQHWTQSVGANQYAAIDNYSINDATYDRQYTELYQVALNDLNVVSKTAEAQQNWNYYLIAETMKAYTFQVLVDLYDKVPYSEALQGGKNPTPKYDNGQDIYDDLVKRIDLALSKDRSNSTVPGADDLVFHGNMDNWVKFANTLKLKLFIRQGEARASVTTAGVQALYSAGAEFLDADAEMTAFTDVQNFRNPFFATQVSTSPGGRGYADIAASKTLLDRLVAVNDPRADAIFATPLNGGPHAAIAQGDYTNTTYISSRDLSQPRMTATFPVMFMSAAESKFLQAEAVLRYGVTGDAKTLYEQGITASFTKWGVTGASTLYGAGGPYEYDGKLETIITQKWIAMANFEALESHFEHVRTGFPSFFTVTPQNVTGGIFPNRLPYTSTELNNNSASMQAAGGQRRVVEHVWWDPS